MEPENTAPTLGFDPLQETEAAASLAEVAVISSSAENSTNHSTENSIVGIDLNTEESQSPDEISVIFRNRNTGDTGPYVEVSDALGNVEFFGIGGMSAGEFRLQLAALLKDWKQ